MTRDGAETTPFVAARAGHDHRRRRLSGHRKPHLDVVRNDINVTPLVDVMLVLLIIFMLMTLITSRGHDVHLPRADNVSLEKDKMQPVVSIDAEGNLYVEKTKLGAVSPSTLKEMQDQIVAAWDANTEGASRIYLKADEALEYGRVYPVLEYLNKVALVQSVDLAIGKAPEKK